MFLFFFLSLQLCKPFKKQFQWFYSAIYGRCNYESRNCCNRKITGNGRTRKAVRWPKIKIMKMMTPTPKHWNKECNFKKKVVPRKKISISFFKKLSKYVIENTHTNVCESSVCSSPFLPLQILISPKKTKNDECEVVIS